MYLTYGSSWRRDKTKPIKQVFRAVTLKHMNKIIERQIERGWTQISDIIDKSESNALFATNEPYRFKVVMEFRRDNHESK